MRTAETQRRREDHESCEGAWALGLGVSSFWLARRGGRGNCGLAQSGYLRGSTLFSWRLGVSAVKNAL